MIALPPRSTRLHSSCWRTRSSVRRRRPGKAARCRFLSLTGAVALLRLIGFLSVIIGAHAPAALAAQYVALIGSIVVGAWLISRGQAIEPAAMVSKIANVIGERLAKATAS